MIYEQNKPTNSALINYMDDRQMGMNNLSGVLGNVQVKYIKIIFFSLSLDFSGLIIISRYLSADCCFCF